MESSYRPLYGFCLSLVTAVLWGVLPLFLKICLEVMDSQTITLYRFVVAALMVGGWLFYRRHIPHFLRYPKAVISLTIACTLMLVINYVFNVMSLKFLSPGSVQVFMQVAPFALMVGGIVLYKESSVACSCGERLRYCLAWDCFSISACRKLWCRILKIHSGLCLLLLPP